MRFDMVSHRPKASLPQFSTCTRSASGTGCWRRLSPKSCRTSPRCAARPITVVIQARRLPCGRWAPPVPICHKVAALNRCLPGPKMAQSNRPAGLACMQTDLVPTTVAASFAYSLFGAESFTLPLKFRPMHLPLVARAGATGEHKWLRDQMSAGAGHQLAPA